ncbi:MAG: ABC transporter substrate-binding protein [Ruminococcaceae bacterium]|jgi:raffinose/stachyose/melibiose transport system substrate-binding protein|nr:ABC transporter substrate-binding protein [Oscillospiraceae bacterium]
MKKFLALMLALIMALALVACGGNSNQSNEGGNDANTDTNTTNETTETGSVYWLNFKPELDDTAQKLAKMYTDKTGVSVKVVTAASGTYGQTLTAEMDKSAPPTMFVITNPSMDDEWGDYALDLTGTAIANELNTDAYNLYNVNDAKKLDAIGYCYECYGIIVNPDLIEKAGHSMDEIKNFEGLKTVAEDIHARADELGFDAFSASDMDGSSSWRFTGHMINLDYVYEERAAGTIWTEQPASITGEFVPNFKNLFDLCINNSTVEPNTLATGGHDAEAEFKSGKAAFFVNGSWEYAAVSGDVPNATMIPYYCGVEGEEKAGLNCGTENNWAVNAKVSEADQKATIDFMVWMVTDPEASALLVEQLGIMPYKSAVESTNGFLNDAARYTDEGCYVFDWATNYQPDVDNYRAGIVAALNAYCADQSDANWETVRTAIVEGWAAAYANTH